MIARGCPNLFHQLDHRNPDTIVLFNNCQSEKIIILSVGENLIQIVLTVFRMTSMFSTVKTRLLQNMAHTGRGGCHFMKTLIIDRFEGDVAVCEREDCSMITIAKSRLPKGVRPGNILKFEDDGTLRVDTQEELRRREKLFELQEGLFEHLDGQS